ncbi:MAG TPA: MFS transporter [Terriglobales bacterium]|jgi:MFS family permease|nr:MFS transporter [Terriglobales bacterium]
MSASPTSSREKVPPALIWVLVLLGLSVFINYIDRANLSVAAPLLKIELGLSPTQLGILLSAFFWTYACMQIPVGWLVDRFDVKWVFAIGFFVWSAATAFTGLAHTFVMLLFIRVILGIGESVAYPSYAKIFASHFVERQRGVANSVIGAGQSLGPALGIFLGATLIAHFGWRPFFVVLGLAGILWLPPWLRWMPRTPTRGALHMKHGPDLSEIFAHRSSWGTWIGHFCMNYPLYVLLTWLPFYLVTERHFSTEWMARIGGATFVMSALSCLVCGRLSDRLISGGGSPTRVRNTFVVLGLTCTGLFMAGCSVAPQGVLVALLLLAGASMGMTSSNLFAVSQTLAGPLAAGRWMGVENFVANLAGVVAPALTGFLLGRTGHFYWPFLITSLVTGIGALQWVFLIGPVVPVVWKPQVEVMIPEVPSPI